MSTEGKTSVTEGSATIFFPVDEVFYNPVQQFNRDISVLGIRAWSQDYLATKRERHARKRQKTNHEVKHKFTILEALSATGLRAIRYAKEIPDVSSITANDLSTKAVEQIAANAQYNETPLVHAHEGDARVVMYTTKKRFNVIDLDPYGSAAPFLDAAVQAIEDDGLLLVTCTDLAVLAGDSHPEKCFSQYGGATLKQADFCHEQALRMVLHTIITSAARYGRSVTPLLSLSIDFYVRLFVKIDTSATKVKKVMSNTMITLACSNCKTFVNQPLGVIKEGPRPDLLRYSNAQQGPGRCEVCGGIMHIGGPMFAGPLHDRSFIDRMLALTTDAIHLGTVPRIKGMLTTAKEELDIPHHWSISRMTKVLHCQTPPHTKVVSAILNAGYKYSGSHTGPQCIKTDAPASFMWDILRALIKQTPVKEESIKAGTAGATILARREPEHKIDFTEHPAARRDKTKDMVRYPMNPTENWGPKSMAKGTTSDTTKRK